MPGWRVGHLTYGKILDPNRAGARSLLRSRERVEYLHPAEHFTSSWVTNSGHEFPALCASRRLRPEAFGFWGWCVAPVALRAQAKIALRQGLCHLAGC
jgi:hypothetical protein